MFLRRDIDCPQPLLNLATVALRRDELKAKSWHERRILARARGSGRSSFKAKEDTGMSALEFVSRCLNGVWLLGGGTLEGRGVEDNSRTWSSPFARAARLRTC